MAGEAYVKRYPGGFQDLPSKTTAEDSQFLNAVEQALLRLLGADPTDGAVQTWDAALARFKTALVKNAQVDPAAGVTRAKLDFGAGLVDADIAPGANIASSKISGLAASGVAPTGGMLPFGGDVAPAGWLLCDGSAVSRTTQASLFAVIGVKFGAGDGSTTFNLPDFRGRVPVVVGTHADINVVGANDGAAVANRRPKHSHPAAGLTFTGSAGTTGNDSPDHVHARPSEFLNSGSNYNVATGGQSFGDNGAVLNTGGANTRHQHSFTPVGTVGGQVGPTGMTDSVAYLAINMLIKT